MKPKQIFFIFTVIMLLVCSGCAHSTSQGKEIEPPVGSLEPTGKVEQELAVTPEPTPSPLPSPEPTNAPEAGVWEKYTWDEVRTAFLEYLNFQAWCNPSEYPQEAYEITCDLYQKKVKEGIKDTWTYLVIAIVQNSAKQELKYYTVGADTKSGEKIIRFLEDEYEAGFEFDWCTKIGTEKIEVPAVTKPEHFPGDTLSERELLLKVLMFDTEHYIAGLLAENGYSEDLKIELIVSDFCIRRRMYPYVYLIINEEEIFGSRVYVPSYAEPYFLYFFEDANMTEGHISYTGENIKKLQEIDDAEKKRMENIMEIKVLDRILGFAPESVSRADYEKYLESYTVILTE